MDKYPAIQMNNDHIYYESLCSMGIMRKSLLILLLSCIVLASGCTSTNEPVEVVEVGDYILVDYTGSFENGTVFDTSIGYQPLGFTVGESRLIKGFDNGVIGMEDRRKQNSGNSSRRSVWCLSQRAGNSY
jgi:hypothetical protein